MRSDRVGRLVRNERGPVDEPRGRCCTNNARSSLWVVRTRNEFPGCCNALSCTGPVRLDLPIESPSAPAGPRLPRRRTTGSDQPTNTASDITILCTYGPPDVAAEVDGEIGREAHTPEERPGQSRTVLGRAYADGTTWTGFFLRARPAPPRAGGGTVAFAAAARSFARNCFPTRPLARF